MTYHAYSVGRTASAGFDTLEEAEKAVNALRDARFRICNGLSLTGAEKFFCGSIFDESMDGSYRGVVFLEYVKSILFDPGKNYPRYDIYVSANTIGDLKYAKSYVDKLH